MYAVLFSERRPALPLLAADSGYAQAQAPSLRTVASGTGERRRDDGIGECPYKGTGAYLNPHEVLCGQESPGYISTAQLFFVFLITA